MRFLKKLNNQLKIIILTNKNNDFQKVQLKIRKFKFENLNYSFPGNQFHSRKNFPKSVCINELNQLNYDDTRLEPYFAYDKFRRFNTVAQPEQHTQSFHFSVRFSRLLPWI